MTNNNNNFSDLPKTATIAYYDVETDQNLTAEQWNKLNSLDCNEEMITSQNRIYISEKAYNQGIAMYGPGIWDDIKGVVKPVATGALVVASIFPPTAAVAAPITIGVLGTGAAVTGLGHIADNKEIKEFGKDLLEIGSGARDGQGCFSNPDCRLHEYAVARNRR